MDLAFTPFFSVCEDNKLVKPVYWKKNLWELDEHEPSNNGMQNEDLIVWMRTAAFPSFRKLYRRVSHTGTFQAGLPKGNYSLNIAYSTLEEMVVTAPTFPSSSSFFLFEIFRKENFHAFKTTSPA